MGGTGKGLLKGYVFPSPFLRTESYVSARIPLPPLRGTLSPGEGFAPAALSKLNDNLQICCPNLKNFLPACFRREKPL